MMLSMWLEVIVFIISICSRALILLGSFSKCKIVVVSSINYISCHLFKMCSENIDLLVEVAKSFSMLIKIRKEFATSVARSTFSEHTSDMGCNRMEEAWSRELILLKKLRL
jgi:hypothetical protein